MKFPEINTTLLSCLQEEGLSALETCDVSAVPKCQLPCCSVVVSALSESWPVGRLPHRSVPVSGWTTKTAVFCDLGQISEKSNRPLTVN